ncbi:MAG: tetratricopeptide repeat protein [Nitrospira sp.]|nr:tetratricopeptide repeat protein [Nitrospira sp.]
MISRGAFGSRQISVIGLACLLLVVPVRAEHESLPSDYPNSLERELASLLSQLATQGPNVDRLLSGAELYLNIADDLFDEETRKRLAYEAGAEMAKRALHMDERNAQAHFLYAATLGSAERLKEIANAGLVLGEIKQHVRRAIELDPTHAQALQMMGGLYAELPWLLGGNEKQAELHLQRAIQTDGRYTNAHLILARLLIKLNRHSEARTHLQAVLHVEHPHCPYAWKRTFRPEAERLLEAISPTK